MKSSNKKEANITVIDLQVSSSFILVSENPGGLYDVFSARLTPRDLLRVPNNRTLTRAVIQIMINKGPASMKYEKRK